MIALILQLENKQNNNELIKAMEEHEKKTFVIEQTGKVDISDNDMPREIRISLTPSLQERDELVKTVKEFRDVFAWSYEDMLGIDPDIAQHRISIIEGLSQSHKSSAAWNQMLPLTFGRKSSNNTMQAFLRSSITLNG